MTPVANQTLRERNAAQVFDLIWTLVRTEFKTRYYGTIGGFAWALLKPLGNFAVLVFIFSFLFTDPNYGINLLVGLVLYDFFSNATKVGLTSLAVNGYLLSKARIPIWTLVVSSSSNSLITLLTMLGILGVYMFVLGKPLSVVPLLLVLLYVALLYAIVLGISLASSVLYLRYRDLDQVWEVLTQAGFFIAPIIYPLEIIPERYHIFLYLWPPTPAIVFARAVVIGGSPASAKAHVLLILEAAICLGLGALIFRRYSARSAEHL